MDKKSSSPAGDDRVSAIWALSGLLDGKSLTESEAAIKQVAAIFREKRARLERENVELAKGVLDLTRRLTVAEQRTKHAEEMAEQAMKDAGLWRRAAAASERWRLKYTMAEGAMDALSEFFLPLAYFPAGEEPGARWGLTELGQAAVDAGRAKGPEWTLLLSPDPREVLSIEVRTGSRQEAIYRSAGYVTAEDPDFQGGHFLGGEVAYQDGRIEEVSRLVDTEREHDAPRVNQALLEAFAEVARAQRLDSDTLAIKMASSAPTYDLAAICARCSRTYGDHILPLGPECEGFVAEAPKTAGLLSFLCAACLALKPLSERAPSTVPICQDCWRKDP